MDLVFVLIIIFQNCNRQNPMWHVLIKDHIDRVKLKDLLKIAKYLIKHTLHRIDSFFLVNCSNSGSICKLFNHFQFKACINLKIKNSWNKILKKQASNGLQVIGTIENVHICLFQKLTTTLLSYEILIIYIHIGFLIWKMTIFFC